MYLGIVPSSESSFSYKFFGQSLTCECIFQSLLSLLRGKIDTAGIKMHGKIIKQVALLSCCNGSFDWKQQTCIAMQQ